jgi:hypothetical protein
MEANRLTAMREGRRRPLTGRRTAWMSMYIKIVCLRDRNMSVSAA